MRSFILVIAATLSLASCATPPRPEGSLVVATWNLEHLAEAIGSGCRPRQDADYAALRAHAASLNADVIAFQEVESVEAASRVFDPAVYAIVMEARTGTPNSKPPCNGAPHLRLNRQATGFAVRKTLTLHRHDDLVSLQDGDPNLRSGVDITVTGRDGHAIRLLSVHLKSGCAGGALGASCETLMRQVAVLRSWSDQRATEPARFAILGDFNRRLALPGDTAWTALDGPPGPTDLTLAAGTTNPACDPRYTSFIDHIALDPRAAKAGYTFREITYSGERLSDHCVVEVQIGR